MKVSLNWLKDYLDIRLSPESLSEVLTAIGLEVEGMEAVEGIPGGLEGVVVGHVLECEKHPNADKLSLTKVDVGAEEALEIVCGAPNVAAGQKVLVATIGTTLHPTEGEPLTIKKGKIRGETSNGMICAEDELGIGKSHAGILILPGDTPVGTTARTYFNLETDYVYEIGLTPNRSDATNHLGVAKDLAAALKISQGQDIAVKMPDISSFKIDNTDLPVEVVVENTLACPRYSGVSIKNVSIQESPAWLKKRLAAVGVRPINNIVDITNFVLHEYGQPLHAFDLDQVTDRKIIVKTLPTGTNFLSLDEVERSLDAEDLMICDGASKGMCIGGVFGGLHSGVKDNTKNIFLEAAHFNAKYIRRSSMRHNLRTDAAKVFEKGSDPNITVQALKRAAMLIKELGNGEIASAVVDIYPTPIQPQAVEVSYQHVNRLIGVDLSKEKIKEILAALEMEMVSETATTFTVAVPTNKADVTRPADVIEEILRIYGFNNVPLPTHFRNAVVFSRQPDPALIRDRISDVLVGNGFHEIMALSLSESRYYKSMLSNVPAEELVYVNNTSNVHLDIMRPTMLVSGLEAVLHNQNRRQNDLKLFEFGRSYRKIGDQYKEQGHLSLFLSGQKKGEGWLNKEAGEVTFFTLKALVHMVLERLGIATYQVSQIEGEPFAYATHYHRGPKSMVTFGQVAGKITKQMGIRNAVFYADFNWDAILGSLGKQQHKIADLNKFPSMRRDLALVIDNSVKFSDIAATAAKIGKKLIKDINLFDVYVNEEQLGKGKKSYAVSFIFEDPTKTLIDSEVDKVMQKMIQAYESQMGAAIR
ncbi:MAG: phenylalanine--tRNA ligase subunit beta [Saprospiraceae bacterium]